MKKKILTIIVVLFSTMLLFSEDMPLGTWWYYENGITLNGKKLNMFQTHIENSLVGYIFQMAKEIIVFYMTPIHIIMEKQMIFYTNIFLLG